MIIINYISWIMVFLYGGILTTAFLNIQINKKSVCIISLQTLVCIGFQICLELLFGSRIVEMAYPIICHLPIILTAIFIFKCPWISSVVALLTAYLLTFPRNLIGEGVNLFHNTPYTKELTKIIITIPLLILFLKTLSPLMNKIFKRPARELWLFLVPEVLFYVMTYLTTVYSNFAYTGSFFSISLLATMLCLCTFSYVILDYKQLSKNAQLRQQQQNLQLQLSETSLRLHELKHLNRK